MYFNDGRGYTCFDHENPQLSWERHPGQDRACGPFKRPKAMETPLCACSNPQSSNASGSGSQPPQRPQSSDASGSGSQPPPKPTKSSKKPASNGVPCRAHWTPDTYWEDLERIFCGEDPLQSERRNQAGNEDGNDPYESDENVWETEYSDGSERFGYEPYGYDDGSDGSAGSGSDTESSVDSWEEMEREHRMLGKWRDEPDIVYILRNMQI